MSFRAACFVLLVSVLLLAILLARADRFKFSEIGDPALGAKKPVTRAVRAGNDARLGTIRGAQAMLQSPLDEGDRRPSRRPYTTS